VVDTEEDVLFLTGDDETVALVSQEEERDELIVEVSGEVTLRTLGLRIDLPEAGLMQELLETGTVKRFASLDPETG
jgi:hypothetical protein